jgi:excisionase family DNA binding protein
MPAHPNEVTKADSGAAANPQEFGLAKVAYSVNETMSLLSIGRTLLYRLVSQKSLLPVKIGKKTLFYASDIATFLADRRKAAAELRKAA